VNSKPQPFLPRLAQKMARAVEVLSSTNQSHFGNAIIDGFDALMTQAVPFIPSKGLHSILYHRILFTILHPT
jgi:diacylglycerol kinase family enzyme